MRLKFVCKTFLFNFFILNTHNNDLLIYKVLIITYNIYHNYFCAEIFIDAVNWNRNLHCIGRN